MAPGQRAKAHETYVFCTTWPQHRHTDNAETGMRENRYTTMIRHTTMIAEIMDRVRTTKLLYWFVWCRYRPGK